MSVKFYHDRHGNEIGDKIGYKFETK